MKNKHLVLLLFTVILHHINPVFSQVQIGTNIYGAESNDKLGWSVATSADGNRIATGAVNNVVTVDHPGYVRVFDLVNGVWVQAGMTIEAEGEGDNCGVGISLSADGNRMAVGAIDNDGFATDAGHVRVFDWVGNDWVQAGDDIEGKGVGEFLGWAVSLSADGNRLAMGAPGFNTFRGYTMVFDWIGGSWVQVGQDIVGIGYNENSGRTLSLSADGSRLAIGSQYEAADGAGYVLIFELNAGNWVQVGSVIAGDEDEDRFGRAISLSADGNRVAIGAVGNNNDKGLVRVFDLINGDWVLAGADLEGPSDSFLGSAVSISFDGNRIALGASGNSNAGAYAGRVRIYDFIDGAWAQAGADIQGDNAGDWLGYSVAMTPDGQKMVAGAYRNSDIGVDAGMTKVYDLVEKPNPIKSVDLGNELKVFPNPSNGKIQLLGTEITSVKVVDCLGRTVLEKEKPSSIDISNLPSGSYFIYAVVKNGVVVKNIIKE